MRLSQESHSAPIISKQAQCLLACINCLSLVNDKYRWIVRPVIDQTFADEKNPKMKRSIDGKEVLHYKMKKQVEVLELKDIRKEYYLVEARLKLSKLNNELLIVAQVGKLILFLIINKCKLFMRTY